MSFPEVEAQIRRCPSLILPVGGLEPVGPLLPLGAINDCCEAVANIVSTRLEVLVAPLLAYGSTIPFKAFGGSAGMHRDTLINVIAECCKCWLFHGIQRIMVLSFAMDAQPVFNMVEKRVHATIGRNNVIRCMSFQDDERFRSLCAEICGNTEAGHSRRGIGVLSRYLSAGEERERTYAGTMAIPDAQQFKQWHRRGRDPEKLRNIAPAAQFEKDAAVPDAAAGKMLFDRVTGFLADECSPFLSVKDHASR
jgi:creatinine amidohydrolase/Fe(II)-dependent formamide hydrolase-like protein